MNKKCADQCGLVSRRDRWQLIEKAHRQYYECSRCGRFIGYVRKEEPKKKKGK